MTELLLAIAMWCSQNAGNGNQYVNETQRIDKLGCQKRLINCLNLPGRTDPVLTKEQLECFKNAE